MQKSFDHPGGATASRVPVGSALAVVRAPVANGARMRIKSATAGARPHLFRIGNPFVSPDGPHQASQQSRLMSGVGNPPLLPNINDNGARPGTLPTAEQQVVPDGAANFGQRSASPNGISPELAAQIVKNYILPMFESDAKKDLRSKYNKLTSISAATGRGKHKMPTPGVGADAGKSVYGELKLSEQLANELNIVRDQVFRLKESLEESNYLRDQYKRDRDLLQTELDRKNRENRLLKQQIKDMNTRNAQTSINYEYMISTSNSLITFAGTSEHYRKKFSEKLRAALQ